MELYFREAFISACECPEKTWVQGLSKGSSPWSSLFPTHSATHRDNDGSSSHLLIPTYLLFLSSILTLSNEAHTDLAATCKNAPEICCWAHRYRKRNTCSCAADGPALAQTRPGRHIQLCTHTRTHTHARFHIIVHTSNWHNAFPSHLP